MDFLGYVFCSAVHLINHLSTLVLKGQSTYQVLHGTSPISDHLRVFGCCCFPYLCLFLQDKLDFRFQPCIFLGYSFQHKSYHCLTPDGKVIVSRYVVFDEFRFLFSLNAADTVQLSPCISKYVTIV